MLVTNHVLAGSVIGRLVKRPGAALLVGIASHFVLDALPHWGGWRSDEHFFRVAVADGLTGLATLAAVTAATPPRHRVATVAGMVGGALPDVDKPCIQFFGFSPWPDAVNRFHGRIQDEAPGRFVSHEVLAGLAFGAVSGYLAFARRR